MLRGRWGRHNARCPLLSLAEQIPSLPEVSVCVTKDYNLPFPCLLLSKKNEALTVINHYKNAKQKGQNRSLGSHRMHNQKLT